ncbi:MAG: hypothetical protein JWM31_2734 [Solirubrobacterales bacterium]|nr:hypothetical protein [Solirubrobacterales bacterium]
MPLQRPVNDRQLGVLRRIVVGRQPVTSAEPALATTVYALRARGLVQTERRDSGWVAVPTEHGAFYAQHEHYPVTRTNGQRLDRAPQKAVAPPAAGPHSTRRAPRPAAENVPVAAPEVAAATAPVATHLRAAHPMIVATRVAAEKLRPDETGRLRVRAEGMVELRVSRAALLRALRLMQGLVTAAERRGWSLAPATYGPGVTLGDGQHAVDITVTEETDRTPHVLTAREEREAATHSWFTPPRYDHHPSGRLRLDLPGAYPTAGRRRTWRDTSRGSLEEQLPAVLAELAVRLDLAEEARQRRLADEALRKERAAAARARATEAFLLDFRRAALRRQVQDWELAGQLRAALTHLADDEAAASPEWRATAAAYADALDPPGRRLELPDDPPVTDSDLAAYFPRPSGWVLPPRASVAYRDGR